MKVLAINGSPRGQYGNTEVILKPFLEGCIEAGAEVETIYLKDKNIKHCSGCFTCWTKNPGKCIHKDDMEQLLHKISQADIMVYATPLYFYTVTGFMKDFMDRMMPLSNKEIVKVGDMYQHPKRIKRDVPLKHVLISNCGFPGEYNFSGLLETFKVMTKGNLAASILCGQGGILGAVNKDERLKKMYTPFLTALSTAGREVINLGHIKPETQAIIDKEVIDREFYIQSANKA